MQCYSSRAAAALWKLVTCKLQPVQLRLLVAHCVQLSKMLNKGGIYLAVTALHSTAFLQAMSASFTSKGVKGSNQLLAALLMDTVAEVLLLSMLVLLQHL